MRSLGFTLILALTAAVVCGLAAWQWRGGNFDALLGVPPTPVGQHLYTNFTPDQVKHIKIKQGGVTATFSLTEKGWQVETPWQDRMDPRAAVGIINFTLGMRVEDLTPIDLVAPQKAGLKESGVDVHIENEKRELLARYKMGRRTSWLAEVEGMEKPVPTVFIRTRDDDRKTHIYACTGDIAPLFKDGLKFLRDHRPLYFNPTTLQKIMIRTGQGELTLGRESAKSPWRIAKPLDLHTDPGAMKSLLEGLFELQAARVSDRSAVTLPTTGTAAESTRITISSFGSDAETTLEIYPPETPDALDTHATVSDRPNAVFDLPIKPEAGIVSLADLPLTVNDLRDPTLTNLNIQSLRGITITPTTGSEILISRKPPQPWMATINNESQEANEERLFTLLKAVTEGRATGFETDAATDFTPWGLDKPFLKLRFLGQDNQGIELLFGIDGKGGFFVNRAGTPAVMRVDESLVASIAVRPYEWRHARLWSIDRINLMAIGRKMGDDTPLLLQYQFSPDEAWQAKKGDKDLTSEINPNRASYMLGTLEGLKVTRWLAPGNEGAIAALQKPLLSLTVVERVTDDEGEPTSELRKRTVRFAPNVAGPKPAFYYGRLDEDPQLFLLDRETFEKIATDVLEQK